MSDAKLSDKTEQCVVQEYVKCSTEKRFMLLNTLLRKNVDKKILVICSSVSMINFLTELLRHFKVVVTAAYENMPKSEKEEIFNAFSNAKEMTLLCTEKSLLPLDGLTLDWFVQYDPPSSLGEYLKMLKTLNKTTHKLIFLQPDELGFLTLLQKKKISSSEFEVKWSKVSNIQSEVQKVTSKMYDVYLAATNAYRNFVKFYAGHPLRKVFDADSLDLSNVALGFGLKTALFIDTEAVRNAKRAAKTEDKNEPSKKKMKTVPIIRELKPVKPKKKISKGH